MKKTTTTKEKKVKKPKVMWGRPRKYDDPEVFDAACQAYFAGLKTNAPNIAGMCLSMGICRDTWQEYRARRKEFSATIRNAEQAIEAWWVNRLKYPGAGSIFYLKNFKPDHYSDRLPGDDKNPMKVEHRITGMRIIKE